MQAMVVTKFGDADVLAPQTVPDPQPGPHDLLVEVRATAMNPIDFKIRRGALAKNRPMPIILGFDVSGVVRGMGSKATGFSEGEEIYASPSLVRQGANGRLVCLDARTAAAKPASLDHLHAATLPLVTITAWEALYERIDIQAGQTVFIQGGGGGVGHVAIQLAALRGCRVLTTASREESTELCRRSGAEVVIHYRQQDVVAQINALTDGKGCEAVFDCVGDDAFDAAARCVAVNGHLATIVGTGSASSLGQLFLRNASLHFEMMGTPTMHDIEPQKQGRILREAARLVDRGELRPHVSAILDLDQIAEGHRRQETGHVAGKIAVRMPEAD